MQTGRRASHFRLGARATAATIIAALFVFPIYFALASSLQTPSHLFHSPPFLYPDPPSFTSFSQALAQAPVGTWVGNSLIVTGATEVLCLPLALLAAYGLSRFSFWGHTVVARSMLILYMFPSVLLLVPIFELFAKIHLINNLLGLAIAYSSFALPFATWFLKNYLDSVPRELDESAMVDGCSRPGALLHVLLPVTVPGLAAAAAFIFLLAWNEYAFASILLENSGLDTLAVGLANYVNAQIGTTPWEVILATAVIMGVPVVVAIQVTQRFFVKGLAEGAVK